MSIQVQGIYVLVNGSWRKVEKVYKSGDWHEIKGIFHGGNWYEIYTGIIDPIDPDLDPDPIDPDPDPDPDKYIQVIPTGCRFDYAANISGSNADRFTLTSKGAWTMSTSWSSGYSNWCWIQTLDNLPISSGSAGTYNLKASCALWSNATLNEVRSCTFTFSSNGNTATYTITQGRRQL